MRRTYIVSYDIRDPKRLRKVYQLMRGWGDHLQLSVFECDLSLQERVELEAGLGLLINHQEDQILFIVLGPTNGRGRRAIRALGARYVPPERQAIVV
jgi:CRISPR-associated protein Cas2